MFGLNAISVKASANMYWSNLDAVYQGGNNNSANVLAVQRFMLDYSYTTYSYIINSGGMDGSFGTYTTLAVKAFQGNKNLVQDGSVGPATWNAMRNDLEFRDVDYGYQFYGVSDPYLSDGAYAYYGSFRRNATSGQWEIRPWYCTSYTAGTYWYLF